MRLQTDHKRRTKAGPVLLALIFGIHLLLALLAMLASVAVRFEPDRGLPIIREHAPLIIAVALARSAIFVASGAHAFASHRSGFLLPRIFLLTAAGSVVFGLSATAFPLIGLSPGQGFPRSVMMLEAISYFAFTWVALGLVSAWQRRVRLSRQVAVLAAVFAVLAPLPSAHTWDLLPERWPPPPTPGRYETSVAAGLAEWQETRPSFVGRLVPYVANGHYLKYEDRLWQASDRLRFDDGGIPMVRYGEDFHYNPVTVAQYALAVHARYLEDRQELRNFVSAADTLVTLQDDRGALPYEFQWRYYLSGETFQPGWTSAMAQGQSLSVFARAWELTRDMRYLESGRKALDYLMTPVSEGGVRNDLRHLDGSLARYIFFEEYVSDPYAYTLNGYIFTLLGLYDWSNLTSTAGDSVERAADAFSRGVHTLRRLLPYYDIGGFSAYDLGHLTYGKEPHVAARYHAVHIYLLHALHSITDEPIFKHYERRWISYVTGDWAGTVGSYLGGALWNDRHAYDAGNHLMVPVHAAFALARDDWVSGFAQHAKRLALAGPEELPTDTLSRLQYLYLWSRFLALSSTYDDEHLIPKALPDLIAEEFDQTWRREPARQWGRDPFPGGIEARLEWKLSAREKERGYYRAVIDEELFAMAIAADLAAYARAADGVDLPASVQSALAMARRTFEQEVVWDDDGGWLFQPGVWTDHPDYAYAGQTEKRSGLEPRPVPGIAMDTSHSHRFPLWLRSLAEAHPPGSLDRAFYDDLRRGLEGQFFAHVLVPPSDEFPAYRTTNFMDGSNGIYRWEYATQGTDDGYGPYELSGTLLLGWWSFLGTERSCAMYEDMATAFPLPEKVVDVYVGPNTTRERHPLVAEPDSYQNGFRELIVALAAQLCR